jgi:large subunit ribosomal protein L13e
VTKGDASAEAVKAVEKNAVSSVSKVLPIKNVVEFTEGPIGGFKGEENAYRKLREARSEARLVGVREKRAKTAAEESAAAKK